MIFVVASIFFFILGAIIGSFLNVVVLRYGSIFSSAQRSECFSCGHLLNFFDLIPVLSFFFLAGKCRYCKSSISIQYPLVEVLTAATFFGTFIKIGAINLDLFLLLIIWSIFIAIFVYDLRHKIIPNGLVYTLVAITLLRILFVSHLNLIEYYWEFLIGPAIAIPFVALWLFSGGRWMGLGDAKLVLAIGFLLGGWEAFSAVTFAFWLGAIVGLLLIFFSRLNLSALSRKFKNLTIKSEIPFAPFLIIGTAIVFFLEFNLTSFLGI